eukprot:scaffold79799_cov38-Prasinocladus_malaysianus.AAC.1
MASPSVCAPVLVIGPSISGIKFDGDDTDSDMMYIAQQATLINLSMQRHCQLTEHCSCPRLLMKL